MPREPDVLGHPVRPEVRQRRAHHHRDLPHLRPRHARHRIEIDAQFVRMIQVVGADGMRVQFQAPEVGHPCESGRLARHHFLGRASGRKRERDDVQPRRAGTIGARFWKKNSPPTPFGYRTSTVGRPPVPRSAPSATAR